MNGGGGVASEANYSVATAKIVEEEGGADLKLADIAASGS